MVEQGIDPDTDSDPEPEMIETVDEGGVGGLATWQTVRISRKTGAVPDFSRIALRGQVSRGAPGSTPRRVRR